MRRVSENTVVPKPQDRKLKVFANYEVMQSFSNCAESKIFFCDKQGYGTNKVKGKKISNGATLFVLNRISCQPPRRCSGEHGPCNSGDDCCGDLICLRYGCEL